MSLANFLSLKCLEFSEKRLKKPCNYLEDDVAVVVCLDVVQPDDAREVGVAVDRPHLFTASVQSGLVTNSILFC